MIAVCEAQCKGHSHEKFNAGFIHGLRLAFPQEKIRFYVESSHLRAIEYILNRNNIIIEGIEYVHIQFRPTESLLAFIQHYFLFTRIMADVIASGSDKLFLLSFNPGILYILKKLKQKQKYKKFKFSLVCHGELDYMADDHAEKMQVKPAEGKSIFEKVHQAKLVEIPSKIKRRVMGIFQERCCALVNLGKSIFKLRFSLRKAMLWRTSKDFKYILLGPHVFTNLKKYFDVKGLDFYTIVLPTPFAEPLPGPRNSYVKFAVFGYGYSAMLQKLLQSLSQKQLKSPYEIRIIGMDNRGTEGYPNITCPSPGKPLSREEMEKYVPDIDAFLILYDKSMYRLSCSGSIMEALSYIKPVLHLENDCVNAFNLKDDPIGICCDSVENMAVVMGEIINNYSEHVPQLDKYRENILTVRKKVAIENNLNQFKEAFTF